MDDKEKEELLEEYGEDILSEAYVLNALNMIPGILRKVYTSVQNEFIRLAEQEIAVTGNDESMGDLGAAISHVAGEMGLEDRDIQELYFLAMEKLNEALFQS